MDILESLAQDLLMVKNIANLDQIKAKYIGKSGLLNSLMQELKSLPVELKKSQGAKLNQLKSELESLITQKKQELALKELEANLQTEAVDVTIDARGNNSVSLHPISLSLNKMIEIFDSLGFIIADGPEIESDYYNFQALNIPDNHPARTMQDTFYIDDKHVLRTHTSPIQIRYANNNPPPIKIIAPGRVYRVDMDATHSPMFHQLEGLWIEEGISFANLKNIIIEFLKLFFEDDNLQIRFRASFFPFTEPSAEIDILSKDNKWLEVGGCGMVHPNVLTAMNVDHNKYTGFAFGLGIDRFTMLRYNIQDLRLLFENDINFLRQF